MSFWSRMKLLIDADYIVYKGCAAAEEEINWGKDVIMVVSNYSDAYKNVSYDLERIKSLFAFAAEMILFFSDSENFRKKIMPAYKGHRNRKKPCGYKRIIRELSEEYKVIRMDTLEADDALGIYATQHPGNIICSPDKDMKQIPGQLYDMEQVMSVTPEEGEHMHYLQTLSGDQTDGYSGVPGMGMKRAAAWFDKHGYNWDAVVRAFIEKDLGEREALLNARLAKILTVNDYDFEQRQPILWSPAAPSSIGVNFRAGVSVKTNSGSD
jgi:DNA polymerase-1